MLLPVFETTKENNDTHIFLSHPSQLLTGTVCHARDVQDECLGELESPHHVHPRAPMSLHKLERPWLSDGQVIAQKQLGPSPI